MIINATTLRSLYTSFSAAYQGGFDGVSPQYTRVAQVVPSSTRTNEYGWMGQMPNIREWIGSRVIQNLMTSTYSIRNKSFESTIGVKRDDIDDDNIGIYSPIFSEFGRLSAVFPDQLVWPLLPAGFNSICYDGQYFFDTDHPVIGADGVTINSVANTDGGSGAPWFLMDASRAVKPIIFQDRKKFKLTAMDQDTDEAVFSRAEYRYGTDGRCNVGYGFWQLCWGSKQTLDPTHYATARAGLGTMMGDNGRPLGVKPNLLVVGPTNEGAGLALLNAENNAAGATNIWKGTAELLVVPWLP